MYFLPIGLADGATPRRCHRIERPVWMVRAVIVPGCGCKRQSVRSSNWYGWLEKRLLEDGRFSEVVLKDMPDPLAARRRIWLPFMLADLGCDASTVVIGHSSGAVAAMRLLEDHELAGALLVSACHTDLGMASEQAAGYYPPSGGPWQWDAMQRNAGGNLCVLHSDDDPFIPLQEAEHVAKSLAAPLRVERGRLHFFEPGEDIVQAAYSLLERAEANHAAAVAEFNMV